MAGTALDAGKTMLAGILAKLPESVRATVQQAFEAPEATDAVTALGDSMLARSDYSRQMDALHEQEEALKTDYANLQAWYEANKATLAKAGELEAENAKLRGAPPLPAKPADKPAFDAETLNKELGARERAAANYLNAVTKLTMDHFQKFNEVVNPNELMALAESKHISLFDAYDLKFGEKVKARAAEEEKARIDKIVEERLAEERRKSPTLPYPSRQAPSVLDVLDVKDGPAQHTVDTAVAEYERLQASRG